MSFRLPSVIVYQEKELDAISAVTPFMELCIVGPVYQCENSAELPVYNVHTAKKDTQGNKVYLEKFPNLATGAVIEDSSAYVSISNVNVKIWPAIAGTFSNFIEVDNSSAVTAIKSVAGATGEASLESANIKVDDLVDITYTDPVTNEQVVKTAAIYKIDNSTGTVLYLLKKNLVLPSGVTFKGTVKRPVEDTYILTNGQSKEGEASGFSIVTKEEEGVTTKYVKLAVENVRVATSEELGANVYVVDCDVNVSYRALRTDIANDFITISSASEATAKLGAVNIANPMSVAAQIVQETMGGAMPFKVLPIASDDFNGYSLALDVLTTNEKVYVIEPLTQDTQVINAFTEHCKVMSTADNSLWRIMYASVQTPITKEIVPRNVGKLMSRGADTETELYAYQKESALVGAVPVYSKMAESGKLVKTDSTPTNKSYFDEKPELVSSIGVKYTGTDYTVVQLKDVYAGSTSPFPATYDDKFVILYAGETNLCEHVASLDTSIVPEGATCYLKDLDTNLGAFVTNKARPTDFVDIYENTSEKKYRYSLMITDVLTDSAVVVSTQKWIKDEENNSYNPAEGEFQKFSHPRMTGDLADLTDCKYAVVRILSTADKAEELSAMAQGYKTERLRFVQPDNVEITVNSVPCTVGSEYLCVALGAMRAGLPPHQGFSTYSISGINGLVSSDKYTKSQLTEMASNGVFIVAQDSPTEKPYVLYQTTTDTTSLKQQEDSCVATVDYASKFYKDNLKDVLGRYNVNTISMNYVKNVINACSNDMITTTYPYIGPILTAATLTALEKDKDKIKPTIKIEIPFPVNGVDVTLKV